MKQLFVCAALAAFVAQVSCSAPAGDPAAEPGEGGGSAARPGEGGGSAALPGEDGGAPAEDSGTQAEDSGAQAEDASALLGPGPLFTAPNPWNIAVDGHPKSAQSGAIIQWLSANGGWGTGAMRIDFSLAVLTADASTPFRPFQTTSDFWSPDCDHVPFPVPAGGALEAEQGYSCTTDGDCHLLVVHTPTHKLYEMWRADITNNVFHGGCAAVWDLGKSYPPSLRGDDCTSADAGGFPISAMLFTADEVYAGEIRHAIRFILPNSRIRHGSYVHPGTHSTNATSGGPNAPPYGVRFRLRANFPVASLPSYGARVVAKAMQRYGMFLADGGNIALTAASDRFTQHKWSQVGMDSHSLMGIKPSDMEVVDMGNPITYHGNCVRNP